MTRAARRCAARCSPECLLAVGSWALISLVARLRALALRRRAPTTSLGQPDDEPPGAVPGLQRRVPARRAADVRRPGLPAQARRLPRHVLRLAAGRDPRPPARVPRGRWRTPCSTLGAVAPPRLVGPRGRRRRLRHPRPDRVLPLRLVAGLPRRRGARGAARRPRRRRLRPRRGRRGREGLPRPADPVRAGRALAARTAGAASRSGSRRPSPGGRGGRRRRSSSLGPHGISWAIHRESRAAARGREHRLVVLRRRAPSGRLPPAPVWSAGSRNFTGPGPHAVVRVLSAV